ncbi:MAG: GGDEF domain-containing protein [Sphingomonadales bacterium]|nr:GGDEF domain-containing protein [Sphingomonadales bacterium]MDE2170137.1 GGDEF domain-containing protein [Sphingomonadales bacterium]
MAAHVLAFVLTAWIVSKVRRSLTDFHDRTGQDPLTDALSKEAFDVALQQAIVAAKENTSLLLFVLADLDDLAHINHRFGRRHGDRVLIAFAQQARRSMGRAALIARTSGDRFAFLVTIESCATGERFAVGLQTSLSFVLTKGTGLVTCSMGGVLIAPYDRRSIVSLMDRADRLMASAKCSGKNAVELEWNDFHRMHSAARQSSDAPRLTR